MPVHLENSIVVSRQDNGDRIQLTVILQQGTDESPKRVSIVLPEIGDGPNAPAEVAAQAQSAFERLAVDITRAAKK
jgi:hypothetical protein